MVVYRGESGRVVMLDAYCPHMGTHLGSGPNSHTSTSACHMEGDNIRCPFHAWRFGPDGICNDIPYREGRIPVAARLKSWPVAERYGITAYVVSNALIALPNRPFIQRVLVGDGFDAADDWIAERAGPADIVLIRLTFEMSTPFSLAARVNRIAA